jgi:L-ectoine synthase
MLVRSLAEIEDTDADIKSETWRSKRIILAKEGVGFSVHETTLYAGTESYFWYANHIEAVFITHGEGEIEDVATGEVHQLTPGTLYLLNDHDKHKVRVREEIRCVCVFNPPVTGREVHDENGVYPLITEDA